MRWRGRDLYQPRARRPHRRQWAGAVVRVRQPAQGCGPQCDSDRRVPDQPQADQREAEGSMTIRPRRSVLYMPGANARALEKAKTLPCDAVILDLEDAVAPDAKVAARQQVMTAVKAGGFGTREVIVRINGLDTAWWLDDP